MRTSAWRVILLLERLTLQFGRCILLRLGGAILQLQGLYFNLEGAHFHLEKPHFCLKDQHIHLDSLYFCIASRHAPCVGPQFHFEGPHFCTASHHAPCAGPHIRYTSHHMLYTMQRCTPPHTCSQSLYLMRGSTHPYHQSPHARVSTSTSPFANVRVPMSTTPVAICCANLFIIIILIQ